MGRKKDSSDEYEPEVANDDENEQRTSDEVRI